MSITGEPDRSPAKVGVPITDIGAGIFALVGILSAVIHREKTGKGQYVDASLLDAGLAFTVLEVVNHFADGGIPGRLGSASRQNAPYQAFETKDGYITVGTGNQALWEEFCRVLRLEQLLQDPRYATNASRVQHQEQLAEAIAPAVKALSTRECVDLFNAAGIPCGPIYDIGQAVEDPQTRERNMIIGYEHPQAGEVRNIGFPVKLSEVSPEVKGYPPFLGEHSRQVLRQQGYSDERISELVEKGVVGDRKGSREK